jgi:MFS family permease
MNTSETKPFWKPLIDPFFRLLWITNVVSLVGTWMHEVGAAWLMTSLTLSPFMIAMVQTATTLPFFLLAFPAGALADIVDRRRLLIFTQIVMLASALSLGIITVFGKTSPIMLLVFTFILSMGAAINTPAWQSIIPELVPRKDLASAITLGSVAFNIARVAGPALGGFIVAAFGPGITFLLNAVSFSGVVAVLVRWKRESTMGALPEEQLMGAMRSGIRYVRNSSDVRAVLVHISIFSFFTSSLWAFLPIVARTQLGLSPTGFGMLLGFFGIGGLAGAFILPKVQHKMSMNHLVAFSTIQFAATIFVLAIVRNFVIISIAMFTGGIAWLVILSIFSTSLQSVIPSWVRGRVISVFILAFFGGMAGGSALWGAIATKTGVSAILAVTSLGAVAGMLFAWRYKLSSGEDLDLTPSQNWPVLITEKGPDMKNGPVLVVVEYQIDPSKSQTFIDAMRPFKTIRLRDGAIKWNLFRDFTTAGHFIESFIVESWIEHLRQHERFTVSDREIQNNVRSFQVDNIPVRVQHFIAETVRRK